MDKKARFMEAVAQKVGKRTPMMRRKGKPGMAVMIAIGAPKAAMKPPMKDEGDDEDMPKMSKADKIAALEEKIAALKAELALLEDEEETADEEMAAEDEESEDEESED